MQADPDIHVKLKKTSEYLHYLYIYYLIFFQALADVKENFCVADKTSKHLARSVLVILFVVRPILCQERRDTVRRKSQHMAISSIRRWQVLRTYFISGIVLRSLKQKKSATFSTDIKMLSASYLLFFKVFFIYIYIKIIFLFIKNYF